MTPLDGCRENAPRVLGCEGRCNPYSTSEFKRRSATHDCTECWDAFNPGDTSAISNGGSHTEGSGTDAEGLSWHPRQLEKPVGGPSAPLLSHRESRSLSADRRHCADRPARG